MRMHDSYVMTHAEIAQAMKIPRSTVWATEQRALAKLKRRGVTLGILVLVAEMFELERIYALPSGRLPQSVERS
jgi:predicted DNA-binding protein (UPF0251 family)